MAQRWLCFLARELQERELGCRDATDLGSAALHNDYWSAWLV
jgi:hypothetical protein